MRADPAGRRADRPGMGHIVPDRFFWAAPPPEDGDDDAGSDEPAAADDAGPKGASRRVH